VVGPSDPLLAYKFWVEVGADLLGGFSECSGLAAETEVFDWVEGGENTTILKFPGRIRYGNITLKHGFTQVPDLWLWFLRVLHGTFERRPLTIILLDSEGGRVRAWNFAGAFPVKWSGGEFRSDARTAAIESVEFAHEGLVGF
jgi:phage tail-like protein